MFKPSSLFVSLVCLLSLAAPLGAQTTDVVGIRAQGMAGAFTAVADDATASWWNPAGMAGGAFFNALVDSGTHREPPDDRTPAGDLQRAMSDTTTSFAVAYPALGLSYYRLRISGMQPQISTGTGSGVRQEGGATEVRLRTMVLNQFGASVGQSLGSHLVVGSTFKVVNGGALSWIQPAATASLDSAGDVDPSGDTKVGLDIGAMAVFGRARVGIMVRNVNELEFGDSSEPFTLTRQARVGVALSTGSRGAIGTMTIAVDGDLTTTPTVLGDERRLAFGGELWTSNKSLGVRAGVNLNTLGDRRTALSGGLSIGIKKGLYADGEVSGGTDDGRRGWGIGARVTF
jgi:F plasmid transfer operon protein TraF